MTKTFEVNVSLKKKKVYSAKHDVQLKTFRKEKLLGKKLSGFYILDKGDGTFMLHVKTRRQPLYTVELSQDEVHNGDFFEWTIWELRMSNDVQFGKVVKLILEEEV